MRVTSQGSAYMRFRRALEPGNPMIVTAAAAEVGRLSLADALAVTLVYLPEDPARFERALVRWHARSGLEKRPGPSRVASAHALADLPDARGLAEAARPLDQLIATY
jgi:hypothetical protein